MIKRENAVCLTLLPEEGWTLICIEMNCRGPPRVCMCAMLCLGLFIKRAMPRRPARITSDEVTPQSHQQPSSLRGTSEPGCTYACYTFSVCSLWCCGATMFPPWFMALQGIAGGNLGGNLTKSLKNMDVFWSGLTFHISISRKWAVGKCWKPITLLYIVYGVYCLSRWDMIDSPCQQCACWVHLDAQTKKPFYYHSIIGPDRFLDGGFLRWGLLLIQKH